MSPHLPLSHRKPLLDLLPRFPGGPLEQAGCVCVKSDFRLHGRHAFHEARQSRLVRIELDVLDDAGATHRAIAHASSVVDDTWRAFDGYRAQLVAAARKHEQRQQQEGQDKDGNDRQWRLHPAAIAARRNLPFKLQLKIAELRLRN